MPEATVPENDFEIEVESLRDDVRWQLVQRMLLSPTFSKAPRLSGFLKFVTVETLRGRGHLLNEQRIGIEVFERRPDYDSADDNIVRSHASRLRQRLDVYFAEEGKQEPIQVLLPRGAYVPAFEDCALPPVQLMPGESELQQNDDLPVVHTETSKAVSGRCGRLLIAVSIIALCLFAYIIKLQRELTLSRVSSSPGVHALWEEVFSSKMRTLIVPADSALVLYDEMKGKVVELPAYMNKTYMAGDPLSLEHEESKDDDANQIAHRRLTSTADLELATRLQRIPEASAAVSEIRYARDLQLSDLKGSNVVLIGAAPSNPWVSIFHPQLNFIITHDQVDIVKTSFILNRSPREGEQKTYRVDRDDASHRTFASIALIRNLSDSGFVLIVQGLSIAGTQAASEFVTNPHMMAPLLDSYMAKYGRIPPFELLLETKDLDGTSPQSQVLGDRVHP